MNNPWMPEYLASPYYGEIEAPRMSLEEMKERALLLRRTGWDLNKGGFLEDEDDE